MAKPSKSVMTTYRSLPRSTMTQWGIQELEKESRENLIRDLLERDLLERLSRSLSSREGREDQNRADMYLRHPVARTNSQAIELTTTSTSQPLASSWTTLKAARVNTGH